MAIYQSFIDNHNSFFNCELLNKSLNEARSIKLASGKFFPNNSLLSLSPKKITFFTEISCGTESTNLQGSCELRALAIDTMNLSILSKELSSKLLLEKQKRIDRITTK
jgi:hypothetical protein